MCIIINKFTMRVLKVTLTFLVITILAQETTAQESNFYLAENGVTIMCPNAAVGDSALINGIMFTKVDKSTLTPHNAARSCVTGIEDFSYTFETDTTFNEDISHWDLSTANSIAHMFHDATEFNQDISYWDISNVTSMMHTFKNAKSFNQDISTWNTSNVVNMMQAFEDAYAFNQDISNWDVSNVTNMTFTFCRANAFNQDISQWDMSNVTTMFGMFVGSASFNQDISTWDVSNVTNMRRMFFNSKVFNQDLSGWNTAKVENMESMFRNNPVFDQNLKDWNISSVNNMSNMFTASNISNDTYSEIIISWAKQNVQDSVIFGGTDKKYLEHAMEAVSYLITNNHWVFQDGGLQLDIPNILSPSTNSTLKFSDPVSFRWDSVKWANKFELLVSSKATLEDTLYYKSDLNSNKLEVSLSDVSFDSIYWAVRAIKTEINGIRGISEWTSPQLLVNSTATNIYESIAYTSPFKLELYPNYPNPFNPTTNVDFKLSQAAKVTYKIYSIHGQLLSEVTNTYGSGLHTLQLDFSDYVSGTYLLRMSSESFMETIMLQLIK
jgi:surface protein